MVTGADTVKLGLGGRGEWGGVIWNENVEPALHTFQRTNMVTPTPHPTVWDSCPPVNP